MAVDMMVAVVGEVDVSWRVVVASKESELGPRAELAQSKALGLMTVSYLVT